MARDTAFDVLNPVGGAQGVNAANTFLDIAQADSPEAAQEVAAHSLVDTLGVAAPPGLSGAMDEMFHLGR
jgi:hypothetical protein